MAIFDQLLKGLLKGGEEAAPAMAKVGEEMAAPVAGQSAAAPIVAANPNAAVEAAAPAVAPAAAPVAPALPSIEQLKAQVGKTQAPVDTLARQTSPGPGPRNFNLQQFDPTAFDTPEQAMATIQGLAKQHVEGNPDFNTPQTWEMTKERAQNYSYEELMGALPTTSARRIFSAPETYAGVQLLGGLSEKLAKQSNYVAEALANGTLTDADKLEFLSTAARASALHDLLSGSVKEAARSTNILRAVKTPRADTPSGAQQTQQLLAQLGGDDMVASIADVMNSNIGNPGRALAQAKETQKLAGWGDILREYGVNNMMSIPTHIKNDVGNSVSIFTDAAIEGPLRAVWMQGIRRARGLTPVEVNQQYVREGLIKLQAMGQAAGDGLRAAAADLLGNSSAVNKMGTGRPPALTASNVQRLMQQTFNIQIKNAWALGAINLAGSVSRRHTALLAAEDVFFSTLASRAADAATTLRTGLQQGADYATASRAALEGVHTMSAERYAAASDVAKEQTFNNALPRPAPFQGAPTGLQSGNDPIRALGGALESAFAHHPWVKFETMTFLKVTTNLLSWIYKRTPVVGLVQSDTGIALQALVKPMLDDMTQVELGTEAGAKVLAQQTVGAAVMTWALAKTHSGLLTGQFGFDPQAARDAKKAHIQPNAVLMHDAAGNVTGSYSTQGFDPFSGMVNVTSTAAETYKYAKTEEDAQTAAVTVMWGWGKVLLDRGYLQSLTDWFNLVDGHQPAGTSLVKLAVGKMTPFFPGYGDLRRLTQTPDSERRMDVGDDGNNPYINRYPLPQRSGAQNVAIDISNPSTIVDAVLREVRARSPYFNKELLPDVNGWGQDMRSWGSYIERNVSPSTYIPMDPQDSGPRDDLLWRNGINHPVTSPTLTFGLAQIDVRGLKVEGKSPDWAWYDYQKAVGAERMRLIDGSIAGFSKERDNATDAPGMNRQNIESVLAKALKSGQAQWLGKPEIQDALKAQGIDVGTFTGSMRARESLPGLEHVREPEFSP